MPTDAELFDEIDELIRSNGPQERYVRCQEDTLVWLGRATALIEACNVDPMTIVDWRTAARAMAAGRIVGNPMAMLIMITHRCRETLRLRVQPPVNAIIGQGRHFDFLTEVRRAIEAGNADVFFVDRYMNADFIGTYLPFIAPGAAVRLLVSNDGSAARHTAQLIPAARRFSQQFGTSIEVRSHPSFHDRYVFVDGARAFASTASFKDGPTNGSASFREQAGEAMANLLAEHEALWTAAAPNVEGRWP